MPGARDRDQAHSLTNEEDSDKPQSAQENNINTQSALNQMQQRFMYGNRSGMKKVSDRKFTKGLVDDIGLASD